jgi:hypothetical protein
MISDAHNASTAIGIWSAENEELRTGEKGGYEEQHTCQNRDYSVFFLLDSL